jgi:hypothetical protein
MMKTCVDTEIKMAHISWVCTPYRTLKYDIYNPKNGQLDDVELTSMCLSARDTLTFDDELSRKVCRLKLRYDGGRRTNLAAAFHEPLDAEDIEEYKQ